MAHFDVVGRLGSGGMGVVYRARDRILGREVALKLVRPEHAEDAQARQRLLREARAAAVLSHPGIATVFEAGEAPAEGGGEPQLFIAQELVPGEPLSERLRRGPLPLAEALRLGLQLAEALAEAHDRGIVHRDVKPSNLMLTPEGRLKVLDFGLARGRAWATELPTSELEAETWTRTAPGLIVGTPAYMAPEQIAGDALEATADVYAAGCVLYELLTGRPPHVGASTAEVLRRSLTETPRPVGELRPDVPPGPGRGGGPGPRPRARRTISERPGPGPCPARGRREAARKRPENAPLSRDSRGARPPSSFSSRRRASPSGSPWGGTRGRPSPSARGTSSWSGT